MSISAAVVSTTVAEGAAAAGTAAVGAATAVGTAVGATGAAAALVGGGLIVGGTGLALNVVGMATGNKTLSQVGQYMGYAGAATGLAGAGVALAGTAAETGATALTTEGQQVVQDATATMGEEAAQVGGVGVSPSGETMAPAAASGPGAVAPVAPVTAAPSTAAPITTSDPSNLQGVGLGPQGADMAAPPTSGSLINAGPSVASTTNAPAGAVGDTANVGAPGLDTNGNPLPVTQSPNAGAPAPVPGSEGPYTSLSPGTSPGMGTPGWAASPNQVTDLAIDAKGGVASWWNSLDPTTKGLIVMTGGQAVAGAAGGMFSALSAEKRLQLDSLINQQRQNQVQYLNQNAAYAPRLSFTNTPGPAGLINTPRPGGV